VSNRRNRESRCSTDVSSRSAFESSWSAPASRARIDRVELLDACVEQEKSRVELLERGVERMEPTVKLLEPGAVEPEPGVDQLEGIVELADARGELLE
jgi:hypothetical protein